MTKSTTKSHTRQTITQRIDRLLDFTPDIKIRKLEQGKVQVNDILIYNEHGSWICTDKSFYRRKSAVGYALCIAKNQYDLAKKIMLLDRELQKIKLDLDVYHKNIKTANHFKREILSHRISREMPALIQADSQLTSLLKSISI